MSRADWRPGAGGALGARLTTAHRTRPWWLINGGEQEVLFQLPTSPPGMPWRRRLSTTQTEASPQPLRRSSLRLLPHSLVLLDQAAGGLPDPPGAEAMSAPSNTNS